MKALAIILTILASLGIAADAITTTNGKRLGLTEVGIPWRVLPSSLQVPGRWASLGVFVAAMAYGIGVDGRYDIACGVAVVVLVLTWFQAWRNQARIEAEKARIVAGGVRR